MEIVVEAPPDEVWAKVGDFAGVGEIFAGIENLRIEGDDRVFEMFGLQLRERLVRRDDAERSITYSLVEGVPIEHHEATISVRPEGAGSRIVWAYDVEPDEMAPLFGDTYRSVLDSLPGHFA
jgi:carbon monoxide dehydrogenase subunit G